MKILVNASTCVMGGGIQVAVSFITQAANNSNGNQFKFAVSEQVLENLDKEMHNDLRIKIISPSPALLSQ